MMLILSPLREGQLGHHQLKEEKQVLGGDDDENHDDDDDHSSFDFNGSAHENNNGVGLLDFPEFCGPEGMGNLLDSIDFDDLFIGIHDGDVLPDLEMDSEMLDFSSSVPAQDFDNANADAKTDANADASASAITNTTSSHHDQLVEEAAACVTSGNQNYSSSSTTTTNTTNARDRGGDEEIASKLGDDEGNDETIRAARRRHPLTPKEPSGDQKSARKSSSSTAQSNNSHGKRKVKVDWTAELHRRFVQAVEQLGVDKAVPSRILELMGIDCLTRHNIASHLQKYRSHRKHLLAREAEAASWTQRRQMYAGGGRHTVVVGGGGGGGKSSSRSSHDVMMMNNPSPNNWLTNHYVPPPPAMGFPPAGLSTNTVSTPTPPPPMHPLMIRPLHVWGHPTVDQSMMHIWPKHHLPHHNFPSPIPPPPGHAWPPPPDASYWHHRAPMNLLTPGTPCFPRQQRFGAPSVPGIPPHAMFKAAAAPVAVAGGASGPTPPPPPQPAGPNSALVDFHPSKESIDAAIGDVMAKPWLPLPLGLRPPATDTVMVELQRQGIPKIPPSCA